MRLVDLYQNRIISAHLGCSRSILEMSLLWAMAVSTIWLISFAQQSYFKSIYTSHESPFFFLSNGQVRCSWLFFFHFFLYATMFMIEVSSRVKNQTSGLQKYGSTKKSAFPPCNDLNPLMWLLFAVRGLSLFQWTLRIFQSSKKELLPTTIR